MKLINSTTERSQISASREEISILNNALNEVCNGIDLFEFETRMGADLERVSALLEEIHVILNRMRSDVGTGG